jgi:hypothetical protein
VVVRRENSEHGENGKGHESLDWSGLRRVKPYVQCGGVRREWRSPLEWSSRPPYMASRLKLPFEVSGPSSGLVTD